MRIQRYISFVTLLLITGSANAGFFGGGTSMNSSASFDQQKDGIRVNFGSHINKTIDLEFNYVDFGASSYNNPTYTEYDDTDILDTSDQGSFENIGFGGLSSRDGGLKYTGISQIQTFGIGAGLKFRKNIKTWLDIYARASFLAWESQADIIEIYGKRRPQNDEGNSVAEADATNLNPCDNLEVCIPESGSTKHQALDFWYGYGFIIKPYSWISIRTEYSIVTLNAVDFPKSVIEGLSASLEIHY